MFYYGFLIFGLNGHEAKQTLEGSEGQGKPGVLQSMGT